MGVWSPLVVRGVWAIKQEGEGSWAGLRFEQVRWEATA
jgi:hypothetical protein